MTAKLATLLTGVLHVSITRFCICLFFYSAAYRL